MEKYYTPSIEEFHFGFEFEVLNSKDKFFIEGAKDGEWIKSEVQFGVLGNFQNLYSLVLDKQIRVKYIDKQDIEELGWKADSGDCDYIMGEYQLEIFDGKIHIQSEYGWNTIFSGKIKNKSELKKLMQQFRIFIEQKEKV